MTRPGSRARYLTATVLMLAIAVVWTTVIDRPAAPAAARTGSARAPASPAPRLVTPATAREVLGTAEALSLTGDQRARLASLADTWERDLAPVQGALEIATQEFARFAREAQQAGRTRLDGVRARTEDVQALSALVRERRARHADQALAVLTAAQRARLIDLRQTTGGTR